MNSFQLLLFAILFSPACTFADGGYVHLPNDHGTRKSVTIDLKDNFESDHNHRKTWVCDVPTGVTVSSIDINSASVSFTSAGNNFIVEYGITGFTPGVDANPGVGGTIVSGTSSPIGLSGLAANTPYDVYVRQVCAGPEYSANSTVATFTTLCTAGSLPYTESFDGTTAPSVPGCITVQNVNGGNTWRTVGTDYYHSVPNIMRLDYEIDGVTQANDWFYTRGLSLTGGATYRLTFYYRNSDDLLYTEKLEVKYGNAPNAASMTAGTLFSNTNINSSNWQEGGVDFVPASTGVYYIGFHGFSDADKAFLAIDDISVDATASCPPPIGVNISSLSSASATIDFPVTGTDYIIEYGAPGFTPGLGATAGGGTAIPVTSADIPYIISGLSVATSYDVYVRQVCTGPFYGSNSTKLNFKTHIANDDAPGAISITVDAGCTGEPYTNEGATQSVNEPYGNCSASIGYATVWYKFVAPASGAVRVSTANGSGTNTLNDSRIALFAATDVNDYSTFSIIGCDDDNGSDAYDQMSVLYATGLTPGTTYYVQVDVFDDPELAGTFCLTVDELNGSMLATTASCTDGQTPFGATTTYTGWVSLVDNTGKLIALVKNPAGATVESYAVSQTVNTNAVRNDATSVDRKYLDRNFRISNATVTNADIQFFFLSTELAALQVIDTIVTLTNLGVTRQTGNTCAADFVSSNGTNSYIRQNGNGISTDGLVEWIQINSPGLSNFYLHTSKAVVPVKAFLQGAYNTALGRHNDVTTQWAGVLNAGNYPAGALSQPYSGFGYSGTEHVNAGFFTSTPGSSTDITDWILLELRTAAPPASPVAGRAAFIREDGKIVDLDKTSDVAFRDITNNNYYLSLRHRNHLGIRTATMLTLEGALGGNFTPAYDFTDNITKAYKDVSIVTNAAMALNGSTYLMWAGNVNQDGFVRATSSALPPIPSDAAAILVILGGVPSATGTVYSAGDVNMDGRTRSTSSGLPPIPSDAAFILSTPLSGVPSATRREHK